MISRIKSSLVRIRNQRRAVVGSGFLVEDKYILTCSHVIAQATGVLGNKLQIVSAIVTLDFPFVDPEKRLNARLIRRNSSKSGLDDSGDIAILELTDIPPEGVHPLHLADHGNLWGHQFRVFGFPSSHEEGVWASGLVRDELANGWLQIEAGSQTGYFVLPGFSGAPVWDSTGNQLIGMVVAVERNSLTGAAFIIPSRILRLNWSSVTGQTPDTPEETASISFNPFEYGSPVLPERFYGRNEQRLDVRNRIGAISAQCISIVGLRRSGKTSLLRYVKERPLEFCRPEQKPLLVYLDFQSQKFRTPAGIIEGLRRGISLATGLNPWENNEDLFEVDDGLAKLVGKGIRLIVMIDEFESITTHVESFADWGDDWRAKMSAGFFVSIIASKRSIDDVYSSCGLTSPFGNLFSTTVLGAFQPDESQELLTEGFQRGKRYFEPADSLLIDELAGGLPYYTQMAAALLWQYEDRGRVREQFSFQARPRFTELWNDLTNNERQRLASFVELLPDHGRARTLADLEQNGLVRPEGGLFSSAFADFVRSQR